MKPARRFGDIFESVSRSLAGSPAASELATELHRLGDEIRTLAPERPLTGGIAVALRMTDGAGSAAAPLVSLAAEMIADHAADSGWNREDLLDYLEGLGPARAAHFLEALAAAVRSPR